MQRFSKFNHFYLLFIILIFGLSLRLYGINWDQNQHLHPDERFLTMVTQAMKWPRSITEYYDKNSPLNPYNIGYPFFVYGTFPLTLIKLVAGGIYINQFEYNNITLVGRFISALFDLGTLIFVYKIAKKILNKKAALLSAFIYSTMVLPIQLSHFFAVDTFLVFFLTGSFYFLIKLIDGNHPEINSVFLGIFFGLANACKISAVLFLPTVALSLLIFLIKYKRVKDFTLCVLITALSSYLTFRIADPHTFSGLFLNPIFLQNLKELKSFDNPDVLFPPAVQWLKTTPIIFPFKNIIIWGLGLPLGILVVASIFYFLQIFSVKKLFRISPKKLLNFFNTITIQHYSYHLALFWIIFLFLYQGVQFAKTMRYFYPIYPFLAIITAKFIYEVIFKIKNPVLHATFYIILLVWPISFIQIYSRPHSRVMASEWIYNNIPDGSVLTCEYWDDCLPLNLQTKGINNYQIETLELFNPDTPEKWNKINTQLNMANYLILSSNRLWGSIPKVPDRYPVTSKFYNDLLAGKLQFIKVAEFTSYPTIPILDITIPDSSAEESFTVYDHPKIIIFKKGKM